VKRRLLNLLTILSLLLCAAVVGSGVRSIHRRDAVRVAVHGLRYSLDLCSDYDGLELSCTGRGGRETDRRVEVDASSQVLSPLERGGMAEYVASVTRRRWTCLGLVLRTGHPSPRYGNDRWVPFRLTVPHWLALLVVLAATGYVRSRARTAVASERRQRGLCPSCGYDVCASPERCPECGTPAATRPA
jgi:hypothetical protein